MVLNVLKHAIIEMMSAFPSKGRRKDDLGKFPKKMKPKLIFQKQ